MSSSVVIVDDRDPALKYTGSWSQAGASAEFDGTTTCSSTQGTSASFTFVGSSVTVYSTIAAKDPPDAAMSFAVDKTTTGTFVPPSGATYDIHHRAVWASPVLEHGTHTLVITQTEAQSACVIFLDYITYQTTSDTAGPYFIDDSDPRITYSGSWTTAGAEYDFLHSTHGSTAAGATFSFTFQGQAISFYGDINNGALMSASISIDKGPAVSYVAPVQSAPVTSNNLIFDSGALSEGTHTIVVTAENANPVWFDYLLVTPNSPGFTSSPSASSPSAPAPPTDPTSVSSVTKSSSTIIALSSSSTHSSSTTSLSPSLNSNINTPSGSSTSSAPSSSSTNSSLGSNTASKKITVEGAMIVGPVIGVLAFVALAALVFFFYRRRRRHPDQPSNRELLFLPNSLLDVENPAVTAHTTEVASTLPITSVYGRYSTAPGSNGSAFALVSESSSPVAHTPFYPNTPFAGSVYSSAPDSATSADQLLPPLTPVRLHSHGSASSFSDSDSGFGGAPPQYTE
ncbi:hypothetical protein C8F04DRAFT_1266965 [Mycena alexandri]|uniref:Uncharacterized protein n=1 Tax=Mycena alexandri TaxID=1745969 RepID=A0AAD6SG87_9AGAR|nr:hypothetical protein C8F04DRAFT_1266965 [Mycena alexandri]